MRPMGHGPANDHHIAWAVQQLSAVSAFLSILPVTHSTYRRDRYRSIAVRFRHGDLGVLIGKPGRHRIRGQARTMHRNCVDGFLRGAFLVCVLDTQQITSAMVFGEEAVEQRCSCTTNVKKSGWRGGKAGDDGHIVAFNIREIRRTRRPAADAVAYWLI